MKKLATAFSGTATDPKDAPANDSATTIDPEGFDGGAGLDPNG